MAARAKPYLSAEEHERFLTDGYCVVRGAVPANIVAAALAHLESDASRLDTERVGGGAIPAPLAACVTPAVEGAIAELMGPALPYDRHRRLLHKPRPHEPRRSWVLPKAHTDNDYPALVPDQWSVGLFLFLTKVEPKGGGFVVYPGSHRRYRALMADSPGCLRDGHAVVEETGAWLEVLSEPGDALLFHHLLGHSASTNTASPVTRHALLGHYGPDPRVAPGDKPFARMSTLEKSESARFLHEKFGGPAPLSAAAASTTLAEGAAIGRDPLFAEVLRWGGETVCLYAEKDRPGDLLVARTRDWRDWTTDAKPAWSGAAMTSLATTARGRTLVALARLADGGAELRLGSAPERWEPPVRVDGLGPACPLSDLLSADSESAGDRLFFHASPSRPGTVAVRRGKDWVAAASSAEETAVAGVPRSAKVADLRVHPVWDATTTALVVDAGGRRPLVQLRHDAETFAGPARELAGKTEARCLRVYARGRRYWLVSYLSPRSGRDRLFWGAVDWEKKSPALETLDSPAAFDEALGVVGLR